MVKRGRYEMMSVLLLGFERICCLSVPILLGVIDVNEMSILRTASYAPC